MRKRNIKIRNGKGNVKRKRFYVLQLPPEVK